MELMMTLFLLVWGLAGLERVLKYRKALKKLNNPIWKDLTLLKMRLQLMTPREFEVFCADFLALQGYRTFITKATRDEGKDVVIYHSDKTKTFVECKLYDEDKSSVISRPIAQKLVGAMRHEEVISGHKVRGMIITTSRFTHEAKKYCEDMGIKMVDTENILKTAQTLDIDKLLCLAGIMQSDLFSDDVYEEREELNLEVGKV